MNFARSKEIVPLQLEWLTFGILVFTGPEVNELSHDWGVFTEMLIQTSELWDKSDSPVI